MKKIKFAFYAVLFLILFLSCSKIYSQDYSGEFCTHEMTLGTTGTEEMLYRERCLQVSKYDGSNITLSWKYIPNGEHILGIDQTLPEVSPGNFVVYQAYTTIPTISLKFLTSNKVVLTHYNSKGDAVDKSIWTR
jgi:hypothetical protein